MFREYMLEKSLFSLVNPAKNKEGPSQSAEVLLYTQLLTDSATSTTKSVSLPGGGIGTTKGSLQHARIYMYIPVFNTVHYNLRLNAVKENCFVLLTCTSSCYRWWWVGTMVVSHYYCCHQLVGWRWGKCRGSVPYVWLLPSETSAVWVSSNIGLIFSIYKLKVWIDFWEL